jgi:hypothetical protein
LDVFMEFPYYGLPVAFLTRSYAGTMSNGRRGAGEEGKGREGAGKDGGREGFNHGDDGGRGRGGWSMDGMNGDVGRGAEGAVCVVGAVGVGVRDLHGAQNDNQKDAGEREENSPGCIAARLSVV